MGERFDKFQKDNESFIDKGIGITKDFFKDFFKQNQPDESYVGITSSIQDLLKNPEASKKDYYDTLGLINQYHQKEGYSPGTSGGGFSVDGIKYPYAHSMEGKRQKLLDAMDDKFPDRAKDDGPPNPNMRDISGEIGEKIKVSEQPILDGDDEKKSFFDRLLSKENRPFLENLGMQLGTNLTAPMNPGENRSLMNQVARSVQGASAQTSAQEKAEIDKLLSTAQAKKALSESSGVPKEYKVAYAEVKSRGEPKEFIISEGKQIKNPEFGVAVANVQAGNTRKEGLLAGKVSALTKLTDLYAKLQFSGLTPEKKLELENSINMLQKEIGLMDGGESYDNNIDLSKKKKIK